MIEQFELKDFVNDESKYFHAFNSMTTFSELYTGVQLPKSKKYYSRAEKSRVLARKIFRTFWEVVFELIMDNHFTCVISKRPYFAIRYGSLRNFESKYYRYNPRTKGRKYKPIIIMGESFKQKIGRQYFAYPLKKIRDKQMRLTKQGISWN